MISSQNVRVHLLRKFVETLTALLALVIVSFLLLHSMPGGPFDEEISLNPAIKENLIRSWALDQPMLVQFWYYFKGLLTGDLGSSMIQTGKSVGEILSQGFSQTLFLNLFALVISYLLAFATTFAKALWSNSWLSRILNFVNILAISLPSLFVGPVLIYVFAFYFNLLPSAFLISPIHYILPILTLSLRPWAQLHMLLDNSLQDTLGSDYIRTAKAKGLSQVQILIHHAYKNSLIPILALSGHMIVALISGSFLVEVLFSIPGLGQLFIESLNLRDYPVVMALVIVYGGVMIISTNVFDAVAQWADPRIRGTR